MDKKELCKKILEIYPDIGQCGINLDVDYDDEKKTWVVHLERKGKKLDHYLDEEDIKACLEGRQCVALGIQIGELKKDVEEMPPTRQSEGV